MVSILTKDNIIVACNLVGKFITQLSLKDLKEETYFIDEVQKRLQNSKN